MERNQDDLDQKVYLIDESGDIFCFFKPAGLPVQPDPTKDKDLWSIAEERVGQKLHLINRLDRPVSGLVLFTPKADKYHQLQKKWNAKAEKLYLAITEGHWKVPKANLENKLLKGKNHKAIQHPKGKRALLHYRVIHAFDNYSLVEIHLITGRFHQIRAQLSLAGHPIKGDVKYGARRKNPDRSIHLHAYQIKIGETTYTSEPPKSDTLWSAARAHIKDES